MTLTDAAIRNAKPDDKPRKLADGKGLYLLVTPSGGKLWRLKYRYAGREKLLALGQWPEVSLKDARARCIEARALLAQEIDPGEVKKAQKARQRQLAEDTLEAVAREWISRHLATKAPGHRDKVIRRLERDIFPYLGNRPVAEVTAPEILAVDCATPFL